MQISGASTVAKLLARSILPSAISLMATFLVGLIVVGGHLLLLTLNGQMSPTGNDVLVTDYTNYVVAPVSRLMNSNSLNLVLYTVAWGAVGFGLYEIIVHFVDTVHDVRAEDEAVNIPIEGVVRRHPLERFVLAQIAWRIFIVVLSLILGVAFLPVIRFCLSSDQQILNTSSALHDLHVAAISIVLWMLMLHCYLVLLRWYMFRTRVTGEILY